MTSVYFSRAPVIEPPNAPNAAAMTEPKQVPNKPPTTLETPLKIEGMGDAKG